MQTVINPDKTDRNIKEEGTFEDRFFAWIIAMTKKINQLEPILGTGSPEGSVVGVVPQIYIDQSASSGTGLYVKESGAGDTGWIARS